MIQIVLLILILFFPVSSEAAYKIYLKDGTVISGIQFYEKKGSDVGLFFKDGSMHVSEEDILKIEGKESDESYVLPEEVQEMKEDVTITPRQETASDKSEKIERIKALQADVEAFNEEIRLVNIEEARLVTLINEKSSQPTWNQYQVLSTQEEVKPLAEELRAIQQKKIKLLERKGALEREIGELQK